MSIKVVIIDDEHWTREVIKSLVDWAALDLVLVGESSDGDFGLELIETFKPEIIITDVHMPNMNGIQLVERLRNSGSDSEVLIVSGYDDFDYVHSAMKLGVSDYLLKPIKQNVLNEQLKSCVDKIDAKRSIGANKEVIVATGFLEASWASRFYTLKTMAHDSLYSGAEEVIVPIFDEMCTLFLENSDHALSKSMMIGVYFGLMDQLQHFIVEKGFKVGDIFRGSENQFVFNHDSKVTQMLEFVCRQYCVAASGVAQLIKSRNRLDITSIKRYLDENYSGSISLEETANRFFISKEYLSKCFKSEVGMGFSEYVTSLRMEKAKQLILENGVPIKDVGFMVGYLEQAHFYKKFKRYFSVTPGEMKGRLKIDNDSDQ